MKKKVISIALIIALVAVIAAGSFAYFTDTKSANNTFTVGNVKINLTEPGWEATGKADADTVYAGEPLAKDPTVTNTGANPCFVRVKVEGLDQFKDKGRIQYRDAEYQVGKLNDGWVLHTDGYFYYTKPLVVTGTENDSWNAKYNLSDKTTPVFSSIVMPTGLTGGEQAADIVVTAQAVQAQGAKAPNWAAVNGMTVAEIAAWFTTCGM